ncbi:MAG: c-type cytochrome [Sporocytophaga sp.]|uniref:c-type cytochrome n=1 Tax=Sporocytophaga sp. TaxID=2231183 RepID=UPI001B27A418|nr:cytochrome c [Sporocytophaga sp.]MBO9700443.1 c-type cytochrome [Sporocytophaga sp.]
MKFYLVVIGIFLTVCFVRCVNQNKVTYDLPAAMLPHVKQEYLSRCEKGKILYDMNCAGCHNTKVKGKVLIPDFTPEQLKGYELRITNARHSESLTDTIVTEEELGIIMTFLSYKKKNEVK